MSIAPRPVFRELETLRDRFERLFSDIAPFADLRTEGTLMPSVDVQETEKEIVVKASLPGIRAEDIDVQVDQGMLIIRGESREERDEKEGTWHVHERRVGSIYRSMPLPSPVKEDQAEAKMTDGVLEIRLPKSETPSGKRIEVKAT
jgi:HSP20 family protein